MYFLLLVPDPCLCCVGYVRFNESLGDQMDMEQAGLVNSFAVQVEVVVKQRRGRQQL